MCSQPLILGQLFDFITGETLFDTLDERAKQTLAQFLVEQKHYLKDDINVRRKITVKTANKTAELTIDLLVRLAGRTGMIIQFGPGSIITRHRSVLAASRVVEAYQIPVVVVTNGREADILDGFSGDVMASGLDAIPSKAELEEMTAHLSWDGIPPRRKELEARILYAFEVDGHCSCETPSCRASSE